MGYELKEHPSAKALASRFFEMLKQGAEPNEIAALFRNDIDWDISGDTKTVPWIGRKSGREGVASFVRDLRHWIEPIRFDVHSIISEGDKAVALGDLVSRVKTTEKLMETEFAIEFTVQDGLITRYRMFEDSYAVAEAMK